MKTTITDIARDTGLSLATISKYLNNKPIRPENRKKIQESIARLHYVPNQVAQSLRSKNTRTVALILPPLEDCLWGKIVNPIEIHLKSEGYIPIVSTASLSENRGSSGFMHSFLLRHQPAGIISVDRALSAETIQMLSDHGIPIVCIGYETENPSVDTVCSDNYQKGYEAGRYFLARNHKNLALIAGNMDSNIIRQRNLGFLSALNANSTLLPRDNCIYGTDSLTLAQKALKKVLSQPTPPSGVVFLDYLTSLGSLGEIINSQITVPEQLSIICFDHDTLFNALVPDITAFEEDYEALGQKAAQLLIGRITAECPKPPMHVTVPLKFNEGSSVKVQNQCR